MNLVEQGSDGIDLVPKIEDTEDPLANIQAASTENKIALGQRKGKNIRRLIEQLEEEFRCAEPRMTGDMAASFMGFSLHAGVSVWSSNKAHLDHLSCPQSQKRKFRSQLAKNHFPSTIKNKIASPGQNFYPEYSRSTWTTASSAAAK